MFLRPLHGQQDCASPLPRSQELGSSLVAASTLQPSRSLDEHAQLLRPRVWCSSNATRMRPRDTNWLICTRVHFLVSSCI
jgi:hypothetical protein